MSQKIVPNLWFDNQAEEAANFYISLFGDGEIYDVLRYGDEGMGTPGTVMAFGFRLGDQHFAAINGGPEFKFTEAVSFAIECADQAEVDYFWEALTKDGGEPGPCGWCKDKYGLSWQVIPKRLNELVQDPDPERASRAMKAMLQMGKIDVAALEAAADAA